jgi:hypothetical protein
VRLALAILVLASCSDPPPLTIRYALKDTGSQVCYSNLANESVAASCSEVSMICQTVLDLRIVSANDPTTAYSKVCQPVLGRMNLCSIAGIDLPSPAMTVSEQNLAVEVAIYRDSDLAHDDASNPICPTDLLFADDGTPQTSTPTPVVGGRAFYRPGDAQTVVDLSCFDEPALQDPRCLGKNTVSVTATVNDFDAGVPVTTALATNLSVSIAEPTLQGAQYEITQTQLLTGALDPTFTGPIPSWGGNVELQLVSTACLDVDEGIAESTHTVTCKQVAARQAQVDLPGVRLSKTTLDQILAAFPLAAFPDPGMVVGIVLNQQGGPAENVSVTTNDPMNIHISYLSANRANIIAGATSSNGIFMSTDAPYGTVFTANGGTMNQPVGFGGLVQGKVNIVVLQFTQPTNP